MGSSFLARPELPSILLRVGLAIVLAYAGIASLVSPDDWVGYLPDAMTDAVDASLLLKLFALYQMVLVIWLLVGVHLHIAGLLCTATFAGIVASNLALLEITFRDVALVFASLALTSLSFVARKRPA